MLRLQTLRHHRKDLTVLVDFSSPSATANALRSSAKRATANPLLRVLASDLRERSYRSFRLVFPAAARAICRRTTERRARKKRLRFFCASPVFFDQSPKDLGNWPAARAACRRLQPAAHGRFFGGERVKLQLARLLMAAPEALLLDEPTNDLDGDSVRWLEDFPLTCKLTVLFVSHDEALLSRAATSVLLLERLRRRQVPRATLYAMGYERFYEERGAAFDKQTGSRAKSAEDFQAKMERYENHPPQGRARPAEYLPSESARRFHSKEMRTRFRRWVGALSASGTT